MTTTRLVLTVASAVLAVAIAPPALLSITLGIATTAAAVTGAFLATMTITVVVTTRARGTVVGGSEPGSS